LDRTQKGKAAYLGGQNAEDLVCAHYTQSGSKLKAKRWRCEFAEIDLILEDEACIYFVEVKFAKSHDVAIGRISRSQARRILQAAQIYLDNNPDACLRTLRYDAALVDACGRVRVVQDALSDFVMI